MGYVKHEWKKDDIIYASLLNEMEDGIEAANQGQLVVYLDEEDDTITAKDKDGNPISITEIYTAWENGSTISLSYNEMIVTPMVITEEMCIGVFFGDMKEESIEYIVMQGMYDSEEEVDTWATQELKWYIYNLPDPDYEYGKFLSVDNQGEYVLVDAPGGEKEKYIVVFEQDEHDEWVATHDGTAVTPSQAYAQYDAGKDLIFALYDETTTIRPVYIDEYGMFGYMFEEFKENGFLAISIYGSYEKQEDEWGVEEFDYTIGGGGGTSALDDDELLGVFEDVDLFDAVYVTEDNTDYILSDESDNILMW